MRRSNFRIVVLQFFILLNAAIAFGSQSNETGTLDFHAKLETSFSEATTGFTLSNASNEFSFSRSHQLVETSGLELLLDEEDDDDESSVKEKKQSESQGKLPFLFVDTIGFSKNQKLFSSKEAVKKWSHDEKRYVLIQVFRL